MVSAGIYELLGPPRRGGVAEVVPARLLGPGGVARRVALKRLRPELAGAPDAAARLLSEARVSARVEHAAVARVERVELVDGLPVLVMELVDGLDLAELGRRLALHRRRLGLDEAVHVARELLFGLEALHRALDDDGRPLGLVHRDVAPSNVMVSRGGEVKLVDLGLARPGGPGSAPPGGKLRYLAPEVARGGPATVAADLFGVGLVLWELLAGERVHEGLDLEALGDRVARGAVPPVEALRPDVPARLRGVLAAALAPDAHRRFASAGDLLDALDGLEVGRSAVASRRALAGVVGALAEPPPRLFPAVHPVAEASLEDALAR
jgi:serine/threonine protein kinase